VSRFVFSLESLYAFRQRTEELAQKEFSDVNLRLAAEERRLNELAALHRSSSAELDGMKDRGALIADIQMQQAYLEGLRRHIKAQEQAVARARDLVESKRGELIEASRERKVVEIMKERSLEAHNKKESRREQKESDDLTSARLRRKGNEN